MSREMEWVCQENGVCKSGNSKERKSKESPKEILELKSTLAKMKNSLEAHGKFEQAEESQHLRIDNGII